MNKLEECARAIEELRMAERSLNDANRAVDGLWPDRAYQPSDDAVARAVIRCLMEPSEQMLQAATMEIPTWNHDASKRKMRAMLQAVLDEAQE